MAVTAEGRSRRGTHVVDQDAGLWVGPDDGPDAYRLVSLLGRGGEGAVWMAELPLSTSGRGRVAIKIQPDPGDAGSETEWTRYGRLLAAVHHPGLVRVREVFVGPGRHPRGQTLRMDATGPGGRAVRASADRSRYVVMDHVEGRPLTHWLEEHPSAGIGRRLRLLGTVADALDELHSGRQTAVPVAHGDVKPGNMIVTRDDATVLVDLGGTRLADGPGEWLLTSAYAAPELYLPDGAGTTPEADRFAFVASVVHVLVDVPPVLDAAGRLDLDGVAGQLATHPRTAGEQVLCGELLAALGAEPSARPSSLGGFLARLAGSVARPTTALGGLPATAAPAPAPAPAGGPVPVPARGRVQVPAGVPVPVAVPAPAPPPPGPAPHARSGRNGRNGHSGRRPSLRVGLALAAVTTLGLATAVVLGLPRGGDQPRALVGNVPEASATSAATSPPADDYGIGTPGGAPPTGGTPGRTPSTARQAAATSTPSRTPQRPSPSPSGSARRTPTATGTAAASTSVPATVTVTAAAPTTTSTTSTTTTPPPPPTRTATVNACNTYGQYCTDKNVYASVPPEGYNYTTFPRIAKVANGTTLTARCWAEGGRTYNWAAKIATPDRGPNPYDSTVYYSVQVPGTSSWGFIPDTYFARDQGGKLGLPAC